MTANYNKIDRHVGARLRLRRSLLGMSQERLGELLGVSFQQVQKYERGANRIGSSRLYELGQIMDVPVSFFFDDMPRDAQFDSEADGAAAPGLAERQADYGEPGARRPPEAGATTAADVRLVDRRETLELVRAYARIGDPTVRRRLLELAKSLADRPAPPTG